MKRQVEISARGLATGNRLLVAVKDSVPPPSRMSAAKRRTLGTPGNGTSRGGGKPPPPPAPPKKKGVRRKDLPETQKVYVDKDERHAVTGLKDASCGPICGDCIGRLLEQRPQPDGYKCPMCRRVWRDLPHKKIDRRGAVEAARAKHG